MHADRDPQRVDGLAADEAARAELARAERVLEIDVGLRMHAERLAVGQAHDRAETQARLANDGRGGLVHDKAQVRRAGVGHCGVPS